MTNDCARPLRGTPRTNACGVRCCSIQTRCPRLPHELDRTHPTTLFCRAHASSPLRCGAETIGRDEQFVRLTKAPLDQRRSTAESRGECTSKRADRRRLVCRTADHCSRAHPRPARCLQTRIAFVTPARALVVCSLAVMSTEPEPKHVEPKPGELLADTDKDLVGSSVMISYSRKGHRSSHTAAAATDAERHSMQRKGSTHGRTRCFGAPRVTATHPAVISLCCAASRFCRQSLRQEHLRCTRSRRQKHMGGLGGQRENCMREQRRERES